jgi:excisionase family DNA binding protein
MHSIVENQTSRNGGVPEGEALDSLCHEGDGPEGIVSLTMHAASAAKLCGVSRATWYALAAAGRLPKPVRLGRRTLWRVDELKAWIDAGCPPLHRWEQIAKGRWS